MLKLELAPLAFGQHPGLLPNLPLLQIEVHENGDLRSENVRVERLEDVIHRPH